jgi:hypothetical protein
MSDFFLSGSFLPKICNMHVELEFLNPKFLVFLVLNERLHPVRRTGGSRLLEENLMRQIIEILLA